MSKRNRRNANLSTMTDPEVEQNINTSTETQTTVPPVVSTPEQPAKPVIKQTSAHMIKKIVTNPLVEKFDSISKKYIDLMKSPAITAEIRKQAIVELANMANFVIMAKDNNVFDACFKFMLRERAIMLSPETVVDGINKFLPKDKITKVVQFYVTFQSLVESRILQTKFTLNVTGLRRLFNDEFANWVISKRS